MLQAAKPAALDFSVREARQIVKDLFEPKAAIYWTDFLLSLTVGFVGLRLLRRQPLFSPAQIFGYVLACLAFYRAGSFTHELVHLRTGTFKWFRIAWNLFCGIPFLMPSFMYYTHIAHHAKNHYATEGDGEYLPLSRGPAWKIAWYLCQALFIPVLAVVRFLVLAPLGWLSPSLRGWLHRHASSLVMDPSYIRPLPSTKDLRIWRVQEAACFLLVAVAAGLFISGVLEPSLLVKYYLVGFGVIEINQIRTLGAHRFLHGGRELTFIEQLLDSVNYPRNPLVTGLWAPIGLRYHALHHLFPSMPYHRLDEAHRRLMAQLPADSPYRQTNSPGLWISMKELWGRAATSTAV
jgi:fatty acid desaturase